MPIASWGYVVVSVACVTVALERLLMAIRDEHRRDHLLFVATALAAAVDAPLQRALLTMSTPDQALALYRWTTVSICTFLILMLWFVDARTGVVRRPLLLVVTVLLAATALIDFVLPAGVHATTYVTGLRDVLLPWGETMRHAVGRPSPWRLLGDVANLATLSLLLDTTLRLVRRDRKREAYLTGISLTAIGLAVLAIIPMDLGLLNLPSLHPFAFLLIVGLMSWDLTERAVRSARLSREVLANERRYRDLVAGSSLLIVELDVEDRIVAVNPTVEEVTGWGAAELEGHLASPADCEVPCHPVAVSLSEALAGQAPSAADTRIVVADGTSRTIVWRTVRLHDPDGVASGMLCLGADVTERREAEAELARTLARLEASVAELEVLRARLEEENLVLREQVDLKNDYEDIVGGSDGLLYVLHKIEQVAGSDASVLIQGETGVGKDLVARTIHARSTRRAAPFVAVNCAALAPSLIESELFGHERGAFTGAERARTGRFELADGGTLFLDEVGDLPLELQAKLLRVLESGELERVGGTTTIKVDVRLIAATNHDLRTETMEKRFREDLFYRVNVYPISIPPLRERREDIAPLVYHFLERVNRKRSEPIEEIPAALMRQLEAHHWPGNVRELQNVVERAALASPGRVLQLAEPVSVNDGAGKAGAPEDAPAAPGSPRTLEDVMRAHISSVLDLCDGQISGARGAAGLLGLHPNTLRSRMEKLGIQSPSRSPARKRNGR